MAAKDYKLCVSGLMGNVYISKVSKREPNLMLHDRVQVEKGHFLFCIEQFAEALLEDGSDTIQVKDTDGNLKLEIKLYSK